MGRRNRHRHGTVSVDLDKQPSRDDEGISCLRSNTRNTADSLDGSTENDDSHRMRMGSHGLTAMKATFGTMCLVMFPSYYFCAKRREHQERVIEMMMAANDFRPGEEMPETVPLDKDHPFLNVGDGRDEDEGGLQKEFVARLKERKEWQEPQPTQDAEDVFREVKSKR